MTKQLLKARDALQQAAIKEIILSFEMVVIEDFSRIYLADSLRPVLGKNATGHDLDVIRENFQPVTLEEQEEYRAKRKARSRRHGYNAMAHIDQGRYDEAMDHLKMARQCQLKDSVKIELFRYVKDQEPRLSHGS